MVQSSLIIPCYNEAKNLPLLLARCAEVFAGRDDAELVIVDNGSGDDTAAVLAGLLPDHPYARAVTVPENKGYGHGVLSGLREAKGAIIGWCHADMQTDPGDFFHGLSFFDTGETDVFVKGRRVGRPLGDVFFTVGMSIFETVLMMRPLWDINAQPNMFRRSFFEQWQDPPHDFSLDLYVYYEARRLGLAIRRFDVAFGERAHGVSHWNVDWPSKYRFIKRTVAFSLKLRFGS